MSVKLPKFLWAIVATLPLFKFGDVVTLSGGKCGVGVIKFGVVGVTLSVFGVKFDISYDLKELVHALIDYYMIT